MYELIIISYLMGYYPLRHGVLKKAYRNEHEYALSQTIIELKHLLRNRSFKEVVEIFISVLRHTSNDIEQQLKHVNKSLASLEPDNFKPEIHIDNTIVFSLANEMAHFDSPKHFCEVSNLTWSECFAAIAVGSISALHIESQSLRDNGKSEAEIYLSAIEQYLGPIYQAHTLAASLSKNKTVWSLAASSHKRVSGSRGGKAKNEKYSPLKEKVISLYDKLLITNPQINPMQATRRILGGKSFSATGLLEVTDLENGKYPLFASNDNAFDNIYRWILKHSKQKDK